MRTVTRQTFRPRLVQPLGCSRTHFEQVGGLVRRVPCYRVTDCHAISPRELAERLEALVS